MPERQTPLPSLPERNDAGRSVVEDSREVFELRRYMLHVEGRGPEGEKPL